MTKPDLPPEFIEFLKQVTGKRARVVINHILEHGFITTEELETTYGYSHPPRAVRDVREQGVPIETFNVKSEQGRTIAAYRFGDLRRIEMQRIGGRKVFSKALKRQLLDAANNRCAVCNTVFADRYLQIDHRVPYGVAGETHADTIADYMLLCSSCNRAKSWSCEHCENGKSLKQFAICKNCFWASPTHYDHIAMQPIRRVDITFTDAEVPYFEQLQHQAHEQGLSLQAYIKLLLKQHVENK